MNIQAIFKGYAGEGVTVYSKWVNGILAVNKVVAYREDRFKECLIITNCELTSRESFFTDDHISDAIGAYMHMKAHGEIDIADSVARANPENWVQDADTNNGERRFMVKPQVDNAVMAVLASCWQVKRSKAISKSLSMMDALLTQRGTIHTI
ncbi:hypothetical protein PQQ75_25560 [Paraburkholderia aspalathi]|uniref:hypothetical protein n=1 Tax=Paraburkholderia aspalathi TaxID=1324617 RepID=UPI0038BD26DC